MLFLLVCFFTGNVTSNFCINSVLWFWLDLFLENSRERIFTQAIVKCERNEVCAYQQVLSGEVARRKTQKAIIRISSKSSSPSLQPHCFHLKVKWVPLPCDFICASGGNLNFLTGRCRSLLWGLGKVLAQCAMHSTEASHMAVSLSHENSIAVSAWYSKNRLISRG